MDWLQVERPELVARYEELYSRGAYAPGEERKRLAGLLRRGGLSRPQRGRDFMGARTSSSAAARPSGSRHSSGGNPEKSEQTHPQQERLF